MLSGLPLSRRMLSRTLVSSMGLCISAIVLARTTVSRLDQHRAFVYIAANRRAWGNHLVKSLLQPLVHLWMPLQHALRILLGDTAYDPR